MGKEVKIGLAVGCGFVLLAGIWYFGFQQGPGGEGPDGGAAAQPTGANSRLAGGPVEGNPGLAGDDARLGGTPNLGSGLAGGLTGGGDPLRQTRPDPRGVPVGLNATDDRLPTLPGSGGRSVDLTAFNGGPAGQPSRQVRREGQPLPEVGSLPAGPQTNVGQPPSANQQSYTVKPGDSLWKIASTVYRDGSKHTLITAANPQLRTNPTLRPGMVLALPAAPTRPTESLTTTPNQPAPGQPGTQAFELYVVQPGDRFDTILRSRYGSVNSPELRAAVLAANSDQLRGNPDQLRPNMTLRLPAWSPAPIVGGRPTTQRPATPPPAVVNIARPSERFMGID